MKSPEAQRLARGLVDELKLKYPDQAFVAARFLALNAPDVSPEEETLFGLRHRVDESLRELNAAIDEASTSGVIVKLDLTRIDRFGYDVVQQISARYYRKV